MKKLYFLLLSLVIVFTACKDDTDSDAYKVIPVSVQFQYPTCADVTDMADVEVQATSSLGVVYVSLTNASGVASFELPIGLYEIIATDKVT